MPPEMTPVDWPTRDAGDFTKAVQDYYLHKPEGTPPRATPRQLLPLLDFLDAMAKEAETQIPDVLPSSATRETLKGWNKRSGKYRVILTTALKQAPNDPGPIAASVTGPLVMGWYPEEDSQRVLDAVTPIQVAHMAEVATASMQSAWEKLTGELAQAASEASSGAADAAKSGFRAGEWLFDEAHPWRIPAVGAGALLLIGGVVAGAMRLGSPRVVVRGGK